MTDLKPVGDWKRVLLKLSGEALMGELDFGIDVATVDRFATDIGDTVKAGTELAVVVGGGNIYRGMAGAAAGMDRANGDYMGMLATVMNALALHNALERQDIPARVLSSIPDAQRLRTVYPAKSHSPSQEGPGRDFCRWYRQPVFYNRYGGGSAGH